MTYNVQEWRNYVFGTIPWETKMSQYRPKDHDSFGWTLAVIAQLSPSILCLQESSDESQAQKQHETLENYGYDLYTCDADPGWFGKLQNVLCSKYKAILQQKVSISDTGVFSPTKANDPRCLQAIVTYVGNVKVCIATLHLSYKEDQKRINIEKALEYLDLVNEPNTILCGDFNSHQGDDIYNYITRKYDDGFLLSLTQRKLSPEMTKQLIGPTIPGGGRIDFIFLKKSWNHKALPIGGGYLHYNLNSDHFPVMLDFVIV